MKAPAAILRLIGSVFGVAPRVPLVDAAVAMIPGLAGQSRTSNNSELCRLNRGPLGYLPRHSGNKDSRSLDRGLLQSRNLVA